MSLSISRIVLAQASIILTGFLVVGTILKVHNYPDGTFGEFTWSAFILRSNFWVLPIVPALWAGFAMVSTKRNRGVFSEGVALVLGIGIAVSLFFWFLHTAIFPMK